MTEARLEAWLAETRSFAPSSEFTAQANVGPEIYAEADADPVAYWRRQADRLTWTKAPTKTLEWELPFAKWFSDGELNASYNCVDRHVEAGRGDKVAYHWVADAEGETRTITYADLQKMVAQAAHALTELGVKTGDRVAVYMPMIPEAVVTMLACARLGAAHSVVFAGFSAEALSSRILDSDCQVVVTADGAFRRGAASPLKPAVDEALKSCPNVRAVLVVRRTGGDVDWVEGRDHWWHELVERQSTTHECQSFPAEQTLLIMYTSGTTAKPKGIYHTTGGYLTQCATTHWQIFDVKPDTDVCWTAADIGWITGHSYIVYGPLANGVTQVLYEGLPDSGGRDRWWKIIEQFKVSILYTAPTTIRTLMKWGHEHPEGHDLSSLRLLGTVGEPINPEAWMWYREHVGANRCPIVDTWWQTETGAILASPLPGITATKPGAAMHAIPGVSIDVVDNEGHPVGNGEGGYLVVTEPWPSMTRGIYGDPERFVDVYWKRFPGVYFAGDGAKKDDDGDLWLLGRVDDVMNISGHRLSTTEVEHALVGYPLVAEAAVVGASDATTGQAIVAFVTLKLSADEAQKDQSGVISALRDHVAQVISPIAKPRQIILTPELPKTRSGKIMRRLLRDVAENRPLGDVTTLMDPSVVNSIADLMAAGVEE
ncbi:MAG TPA: acetate--CoA ligase [Acidimicrobiales bacterium]|nr:MAG: acetate--CoA ligase [Actinobacteria bacterium 21-73-9]HQU26981.1 acetate--CoA ligase [Acidimicrobiales bacterium]